MKKKVSRSWLSCGFVSKRSRETVGEKKENCWVTSWRVVADAGSHRMKCDAFGTYNAQHNRHKRIKKKSDVCSWLCAARHQKPQKFKKAISFFLSLVMLRKNFSVRFAVVTSMGNRITPFSFAATTFLRLPFSPRLSLTNRTFGRYNSDRLVNCSKWL